MGVPLSSATDLFALDTVYVVELARAIAMETATTAVLLLLLTEEVAAPFTLREAAALPRAPPRLFRVP